jgi:hypothetical protein
MQNTKAGRMPRRDVAAVVAITVLGVALRVVFATQSLNADELSTRWIVAGRSLADAISTVHTDAEITPPLYFALAWLTTRIDVTAGLLRAPALVAGAAAMPLAFAIGVRTVGRRAALVGTALVALSPFLIFYAAEARAYELVTALVMVSTLAMLLATERRRAGWWVLYAVASCAAVYTHYTAVFPLAAQLGWLLWRVPEARRPALIANLAAAVGFLPWLSGLRGDLDSRTTDILFALEPFNAHTVRVSVTHWLVGYPPSGPLTGLGDLPGPVALVMLALGVVLGAVGVALLPRPRRWPGPAMALAIVLALAAPVGELLVSAAGSNLLASGRNLAASWPGVALALGALVVAGRRPLAVAATALTVGSFAIGAAKLLGPDYQRPDYRAAARVVDAEAGPHDAVVDRASISPAGVPPALQVAFRRPHRVFYPGRADVRYDPFRIVKFPEPLPDTVRKAAAYAAGGRVFLVLAEGFPQTGELIAAMPSSFREVSRRRFRGSTPLLLIEFADRR